MPATPKNYAVRDTNSNVWYVNDVIAYDILSNGVLDFTHVNGKHEYFGVAGWLTFWEV